MNKQVIGMYYEQTSYRDDYEQTSYRDVLQTSYRDVL